MLRSVGATEQLVDSAAQLAAQKDVQTPWGHSSGAEAIPLLECLWTDVPMGMLREQQPDKTPGVRGGTRGRVP